MKISPNVSLVKKFSIRNTLFGDAGDNEHAEKNGAECSQEKLQRFRYNSATNICDMELKEDELSVNSASHSLSSSNSKPFILKQILSKTNSYQNKYSISSPFREMENDLD